MKPTKQRLERCTAVLSPPESVVDLEQEIMNHANRPLINNDRIKPSKIPAPILIPKIHRTVSLREKPFSKYSITELVEKHSINEAPAFVNEKCANKGIKTDKICVNDKNIIVIEKTALANEHGDHSTNGGNPSLRIQKLKRAATIKVQRTAVVNPKVEMGTVTKTDVNTFKPEDALARTPSVSLKRSISVLRAKYQGIPPKEDASSAQPNSNSISTSALRLQLEMEIHEKMRMLPSVAYQQRQGANFSAGWSWIRMLRKNQEEVVKESCEVKRYHIVRSFWTQVRYASTIFEQIQHDFFFGLDAYEPGKLADRVCRSLLVKDSRTKGTYRITDDSAIYMDKAFQIELSKQKAYQKFTEKKLTDIEDIEKRDEVSCWLIEMGRKCKYGVETVHLAVFLLDAFLTHKHSSSRVRTRSTWKSLGIAVLHIAGKFEETTAFNFEDLITLSGYFSDFSINNRMAVLKSAAIMMESEVLTRLSFEICPPLAPVLANMVLTCGSLDFPTLNLRKLAMDLCQGILLESLKDHHLSSIPAADKAKAALEISVDFIFFQYPMCCKRDMSAFSLQNNNPGQSLGSFVLSICMDAFKQRFASKRLPCVIPAVANCTTANLRRDIKA